MIRLASIVMALLPAHAVAQTLTDGDGRHYDIACPVGAYVLARDDGATFTLAVDCKADDGTSPGRWCEANGGVTLTFEGARITFARQELLCDGNALDATCPCATTD